MPLDKNLTGEQIQQVLDLFLYKALEPIILNTDIFDAQASYILALVSSNRKRKPSSLPRERIIELLCKFLASTSRPDKFRMLREARIEKSFLHVFIGRVMQVCQDSDLKYTRMMMAPVKERRSIKADLDLTAKAIGCSDRQGLYRIVSIGSTYLKKFYECRSLVLDHYLKMSSSQASMYIKANGPNFDFYDVRQTILKGVLVAIDKYDSNKGALTSYINWWILNAQTCGATEHEYGIAYTIPQAHRKRIAEKNTGFMNYSVSLDDAVTGDDSSRTLHSIIGSSMNVSEDFEQNETDAIIMRLAKIADIRGCARLVLDVGEYFTSDEVALMEAHTKEEFV